MDLSTTVDQLKHAGLSLPETLTLAITSACNLSCAHCWVEAGESQPPPVPGVVLRSLLRDFSRLGGSGLRLTGGEPLLHPDWLDLLGYAAELGLSRLILQSNGILFRAQDVTALKRLDLKHLQIQISLDGVNATTHDLVRGTGAYARTMRGIELLCAQGLGENIALFFTEMRHNLHELPELFLVADRLGVGSLSSGTLVRCGRARDDEVIAPPDPEQYLPLVEKYAEDSEFQQLYARLGRVAALEWSHCESSQRGCTFIKNPYLTATGVLYPCLMCHAEEYSVLGLFEKGLDLALREGAPLWSRLQQLSQGRATALPACQNCSLRQSCAAGCMGRAWGSFGAFLATDDRCQQRQAVMSWKEKS
ncbi:radical SAM protein [Geopsychrobacter electrodiphilus]|uniref:radical SAM protein n=1 Tax=Geopsychrobacter electrodiphilus TaxID=225196 RepID=UPI000366D6A6|nr:radical SAM protein [Geopsychrobacter electrodiphilus]